MHFKLVGFFVFWKLHANCTLIDCHNIPQMKEFYVWKRWSETIEGTRGNLLGLSGISCDFIDVLILINASSYIGVSSIIKLKS
jgi:hypothetical protein